LRDRGGSYEIDARYCDQYGQNVTGNLNGYLRKK
jgi:cephalosporin hydroxylase